MKLRCKPSPTHNPVRPQTNHPQRANSSWSLARLWILIFAIQSSLVMLSSWLLPPAARTALTAASTLGHGWSVTVLWELMNARYFAVKADEQELHDLMGGL